MRAYFFGNMYLSSIQQGIQSAHVVHQMFVSDPENEMLWEWATNHKTMVLLNGGFGENLHNFRHLFSSSANPYPWAGFFEEPAALDGALTSVGIIVPEKVYETVRYVRRGDTSVEKLYDTGVHRILDEENHNHDVVWTFTKFDVQLIDSINGCKLAQ